MTTEVHGTPSLASSRYVPECYTAHINSLINWPWPEGTTQADILAHEDEIIRTVIEIAEKFADNDLEAARQMVAEKLPTLPAEWSPLLYFEAVAQQMALPVWGEYTPEQQHRGHRYAARYIRARLVEWLRPFRVRHHSDKVEADKVEAGEEKFVYSDLPRAARWAYTSQVLKMTEYRRWLAQMQAFLATHPDDEFEPALLRTITVRWTDVESEQAFF